MSPADVRLLLTFISCSVNIATPELVGLVSKSASYAQRYKYVCVISKDRAVKILYNSKEFTVGSGTWVYSSAHESISLKTRLALAHSKILSNTYSIGVTDVTATWWYADVAGKPVSLKAFITST